MGSKLFPSKMGKTTILNSQSIRMLQTHVKNDIYNKYCLIHNNILAQLISSSSVGFWTRNVNIDALVMNLYHVLFCQYIM